MRQLLFGTAGIPLSTIPRTTLNGIKMVKELGLSAMELEFVHSVTISEALAPGVRKAKENEGIELTCHGQYYMNLNSLEKEKRNMTVHRILKAARTAWMCGAWSICFHAAYYMEKPKDEVYNVVKESLQKISEELRNEKNNIWIRPELTGKGKQFGTLEELLQLSREVEQVMPCIDFSHCHARFNGKFNTYKEFMWILEETEKALGKKGTENMHIHAAGIEYGPGGEKSHKIFRESDFDYKALMKALADFGAKGIVICESPNLEGDALLMQKEYGKRAKG